jgi:hypothetical protein
MIGYETDIKVLILTLIFYIPQHVSICREHHQVVFEYMSIAIDLPVKIYPFFMLNFHQ